MTKNWLTRVAILSAMWGVGLPQGANSVAAQPASPGNSTGKSTALELQGDSRDRGEVVFKTVCAACHENPGTRAPSRAILRGMSPTTVVRALKSGVMSAQGKGISDLDKLLVAEYLTKNSAGEGSEHLSPPPCKGAARELAYDKPPVFPGWGLELTNTRAIPSAVSGIDRANLGRLRLKWALGFAGAIRIRSQPTIAGGAIFVGSQEGILYALDLKSGCERWHFQAPSEIRTGIVVSSWQAGDRAARPLVYFGTKATVYAVDARSGAEAWHSVPDIHPMALLTAPPVVFDGRVYVSVASLEEVGTSTKYECCTFRGSVVAFDAVTGKVLWRTFTVDEPTQHGVTAAGTKIFAPSGAGVWSPVAIDTKRAQLYFGTGDNYSRPTSATSDSVMALDLATGKINWVYQALGGDVWNTGCIWGHRELCPTPEGPDADFGAAVVLATASDGHDVIVAAQKSGFVYGLEPATGQLIWKTKVGRGGTSGGIEFGLAVSGDSVFVGVNDFDESHRYSEPPRPGLYALDLRTGSYLWQAPDSGETCRDQILCSPGIYAAITATPDFVFAGDTDGWLRIYDAKNGRILWHYDMTQSVSTVGGGEAHGGSMGGPTAPIAVDGMLIVPSGYGMVQYAPGNVLLVFDTK